MIGNNRLIFFIAICFFSINVLSAFKKSKSFAPENDLWISPSTKNINGMTEALFNEIIDKVEDVYAPIVDDHGGRLIIERKWREGTVNAYAYRRGRNWNVAMFGGLARHQAVTADSFALVVCHELGHHLGGVPLMPSLFTSWASNEGQADYYATLKCMRKVFLKEDNAEVMNAVKVPTIVQELCFQQHHNLNEQFLCQRSAMAGMSLARLLQSLRNSSQAPSFYKRDTTIVTETKNQHPATQCRLDTYMAGALCQVSHKDEVSYRDESEGVCYRFNGDSNGSRPLCWFRPKRI